MSMIKYSIVLFSLLLCLFCCASVHAKDTEGFVAVLPMDMMILPGTDSYLAKAIQTAETQGAKLVVVLLNTPGGLLDSSQRMIQTLFKARVPVAVYVAPSGSSATSAGVFITLAGHVAAMAPGTTIGAAHPVSGDGKNLESDMRAKAENMTVAMVKSISEQRGRNAQWAEKSVKESSSITEKEALKMSVVDLVAEDMDELLRSLKGREIKLDQERVVLPDYSKLPRRVIEMDFKDRALNVLANPNVAALLWLAATTGLSIELYNPGAILPGVVGVICLILALAVSQVIPINQGAILLFVIGALLIGAELYVPSGILGIGGIIAMLLGAIYLMDVAEAPGLGVDLTLVVPLAILFGGFALFVARRAALALRSKASTGAEGLIGLQGVAKSTISAQGKVFVNGELWDASAKEGLIEQDAAVQIVAIKNGMRLEVKKI